MNNAEKKIAEAKTLDELEDAINEYDTGVDVVGILADAKADRESPKDPTRCAECGEPLGEMVWRASVLPWLYCSKECLHGYLGKDGELPDQEKS